MDSETMKQLLERYWRGETSLEEESRLRAYFAEGQTDPDLQRYQAWFAYQKQQQKVGLDPAFDERLLHQLEKPVEARRLTLAMRFVPLFRAAGVVLLLLALGHGMQHAFLTEEPMPCANTIDQQISAPSVALSEKTLTTETLPADTLSPLQDVPDEPR